MNGAPSEYANKSLEPVDIEFRYICNYLGFIASNNNYMKNKEIFDSFIKYRLNIIAKYETSKKEEFNKRFYRDF